MKQKPSKLDAYADRLTEWFENRMSLEEVQKQLALDGCSVSLSRLSDWDAARRARKLEQTLLNQITSAADQVKDVEKTFAANPAPAMETIIKLNRVIIMQLATQSQADPELLKLVDQLTRTALDYQSGQTKAALEKVKLDQGERKLKLLEAKAAAYDRAQAALKASGGITPETLKKIEAELKLL